MKKILMISSEYPNVEKSNNIYTDLAEELKESGYDIKVVVVEESKNIDKTILKKEKDISVLRVKVGNLYNVGFIEKGITFLKSGFLMKKALSKYYGKDEFDLILTMSQPLTLVSTIKWAMRKYKCRSYLMMKDIFPQNGLDIGVLSKKNPIYWYFKIKEKQLYKTVTTIGCMSQKNIDYLLENNKFINKEKMEIFPNTEKLKVLNERNKNYPLRKKYNIPENAVLAVYGGNLGKPQGVDFFKEVLKYYKDNELINFLIIARGTEKNDLYKFIDDNNIKNVYKYDLMPRDDYQKILEECDIGLIFLDKRFTIPNFPSKTLAYFNLGIPVMAALDLNNDFKDMIDISKSGFWTEAGNVNDYADKMNKLIKDENLRLDMGMNGRKYLEENYTVDKSVKIIDNYLNQGKDDKNV